MGHIFFFHKTIQTKIAHQVLSMSKTEKSPFQLTKNSLNWFSFATLFYFFFFTFVSPPTHYASLNMHKNVCDTFLCQQKRKNWHRKKDRNGIQIDMYEKKNMNSVSQIRSRVP